MKNIEKLNMNNITENRERLDIIFVIRNIRRKLVTINDRLMSKERKAVALKALNDYEFSLPIDIKRSLNTFEEMATEFGNGEIQKRTISRDQDESYYQIFRNSGTFEQLESDIVELTYQGMGQEISVEKVDIPYDLNKPDVSEFVNMDIYNNLAASIVYLKDVADSIPALVSIFSDEERKVFLYAIKNYCHSLENLKRTREKASKEFEDEFEEKINEKEPYVPMSQAAIREELFSSTRKK